MHLCFRMQIVLYQIMWRLACLCLMLFGCSCWFLIAIVVYCSRYCSTVLYCTRYAWSDSGVGVGSAMGLQPLPPPPFPVIVASVYSYITWALVPSSSKVLDLPLTCNPSCATCTINLIWANSCRLLVLYMCSRACRCCCMIVVLCVLKFS